MANFRPAVAGIPGVAVLPLVKKSRASSEMSRKSAGIPGVAVMPLVKKQQVQRLPRKSPLAESFDTQLTLPLPLTCTAEKRRGPRPVLRGQCGGVINFRE